MSGCDLGRLAPLYGHHASHSTTSSHPLQPPTPAIPFSHPLQPTHQSGPEAGTSVKRKILLMSSSVVMSGDRPPCMHRNRADGPTTCHRHERKKRKTRKREEKGGGQRMAVARRSKKRQKHSSPAGVLRSIHRLKNGRPFRAAYQRRQRKRVEALHKLLVGVLVILVRDLERRGWMVRSGCPCESQRRSPPPTATKRHRHTVPKKTSTRGPAACLGVEIVKLGHGARLVVPSEHEDALRVADLFPTWQKRRERVIVCNCV